WRIEDNSNGESDKEPLAKG
ncbi:hypothetical protein A2U01_0047832, partial [Trifolium medium]|nr:hypothetical protein [Trifolium medium]